MLTGVVGVAGAARSVHVDRMEPVPLHVSGAVTMAVSSGEIHGDRSPAVAQDAQVHSKQPS